MNMKQYTALQHSHIEQYFELAEAKALETIEVLARDILRKHKNLDEFIMAMGTWSFTSKAKTAPSPWGGGNLCSHNYTDADFAYMITRITKLINLYNLTCARCGKPFIAMVWYKWCDKCRNKKGVGYD